jgi:Predicted transcriptional regulators
MDIGIKISHLREARGWTKYKLSKITGIDQSSLSRFESGKVKPGVEMLQKIAKALGVSMAEFDDSPSADDQISDVLAVAENMHFQGEYKTALDKLKAMPKEEQQARLDRAFEKIKRLSPEAKEALLVLINNLPTEGGQ